MTQRRIRFLSSFEACSGVLVTVVIVHFSIWKRQILGIIVGVFNVILDESHRHVQQGIDIR